MPIRAKVRLSIVPGAAHTILSYLGTGGQRLARILRRYRVLVAPSKIWIAVSPQPETVSTQSIPSL